MIDPVLLAIGRAVLAHCPHAAGASERWHRDPRAEWRITREPCALCAELAALLGVERTPTPPGA